IGGLTSVYLIARTTFGADEARRAASVRVLGLRAPLGAFLCGWGALAMVASAPFDNWWHEAYGLDVKVLSPPHAVLALGALGPVFQRVPYMVPLGFPVLVVAPAIALDVVWTRIGRWPAWARVVAAGLAFTAAFVPVQWLFADFLTSPLSHGWVFGTHYQMYMV